MEPTRSGNQRLTMTGIRTLLTAMPIRARALAARKPAVPPTYGRISRPPAIATMPAADDGGRAEAAGEPGCHGAEDGEAERRYGGEKPGDAAAHAEPDAHLFEEGPEAGDGGTEVEGRQDDAHDHQARRPRARVPRRSSGLRFDLGLCGCGSIGCDVFGRDAFEGDCRRQGFLAHHDTHHRIIG